MNFLSLFGEDLLLDLPRKYRKLVPQSSKSLKSVNSRKSYSAGISTFRLIDFVVSSIVAFVKADFFARLEHFI